MKTRTALIYLAVFLLLGGYFYYFEVVRRETRSREEEAARQLFRVERDQITALKLNSTYARLISLQKNNSWLIVEPINTRADESAVAGLLAALQSIKLEKEVQAATADLKPYGLDKPKLHLSFLAGGTWHNLRVGAKAAVGENFYASGDQEDRIVLITGAEQSKLNKSLFDLRSKEFFTLKSGEIDRIEIERPDYKLALDRTDKDRWKASTVPDLKIKASKVDNLISRLIWLRATSFADQKHVNITELGLNPASARISLSAEDKQEELILGNTKKNEGTYAKSAELPGIAVVDERLLEELPSNLSDLEDRTFLAFELDQIKALALEVDGNRGRLEREGEKWKWVGDSQRKRPENWQVNALLWKVKDLEYLPDFPHHEQSPPEKKHLSLVLFSENETEIGTFVLAELPSEEADKERVWFLKEGEMTRLYWSSGASLLDLHESAKQLMTNES